MYSIPRKELFWQYKFGSFILHGLNKRQPMLGWICLFAVLPSSLTIALNIIGHIMARVLAGWVRVKNVIC